MIITRGYLSIWPCAISEELEVDIDSGEISVTLDDETIAVTMDPPSISVALDTLELAVTIEDNQSISTEVSCND